jgi:glutamyl-tRNA reductase
VDPAAKALPGVTVLDLDDLRAHTEAGLDDRRAALGEAKAIVAEAVDRYVGERSSRVAVPVIAAMRQQAEALRQAELARHLPRLSQLGPREQEAVAALTKALLAKLLHGPTMVLKDAAGSPRGARLAEAAAELFDLEP